MSMTCTCKRGDARNPDTHNNRVRNLGRCHCGCHRRECASCGKSDSWDLCRDCGGR